MLTRDGDRFRYRPAHDVMVEWFRLMTDLIHSVLGINCGEGRWSFRPDLPDRFVRHNYIQMQVYLGFFMQFLRDTPLQSLMPCMRNLNTKLLEVSEGYVGIYAPDLHIEGTSIIPGNIRSTPWPDDNGSIAE